MKTISIDNRTIIEIDEIRKIRGFYSLSNSEFLHLVISAFNRRR